MEPSDRDVDDDAATLAAFEAGLVDPKRFGHVDHVRIAWLLLRAERFTTAAERMSAGLRRMLARTGNDAAYHETLTVGFLALIAERLDDATDFATFTGRHPDLFERDTLVRLYGRERLASPLARRTFVLPR